MKIEEAIKCCKDSGLVGWELVTFVQKLVGEQMSYSNTNPTQFPKKAFERGEGYCWQQAACIHYILKELHMKSELVYAKRTQFPSKLRENKEQPSYVSGHTWCQVTIKGEVKDVCSCDEENLPGRIHFTTLSAVRPYRGLVMVGGYLGSIIVCYRRVRKQKFYNH